MIVVAPIEGKAVVNDEGGPDPDRTSHLDRTPDPDRTVEWAAVYVEHATRLIRLATVLIGPDDAPDLVTEAIRRAVHARQWTQVERRGAYLTVAVVNEARQLRRRRTRRRDRELRAQRLDLEPVPVELDVDTRAALDVLSDQQRAIVYLHYWEDLSIPQVALELAVSEGSVRKQLARAKDRLRKVLS